MSKKDKTPTKNQAEKKASDLRLGITILIALGTLTGVEYWISFLETPSIALFIIALFKAVLILQYFMHSNGLWSDEESH